MEDSVSSPLNSRLSNITAASFDRLRERPTNVEGGLLDIMMLIAVTCQLKKHMSKTIIVEYLRIQTELCWVNQHAFNVSESALLLCIHRGVEHV